MIPPLFNSSPSTFCHPPTQCSFTSIIPCNLEPVPHLQTNNVLVEDITAIDVVIYIMGLQTIDDNGVPIQNFNFLTEKPPSLKGDRAL